MYMHEIMHWDEYSCSLVGIRLKKMRNKGEEEGLAVVAS
jgi:hypothetical protein